MARSEAARARPIVPEDPDYWLAAELSPRRVQVELAGETVAASGRVMLFRERGRTPVYYFPLSDVRIDLLTPVDGTVDDPNKGWARYFNVAAGERVAERAAYAYPEPHVQWTERPDYVAFVWDRMDHWYEENTEVYKHARDPYHRVDAMPSARHVRIVVGGETIADTHRPHVLFETNHPVRYYIPAEDIRMDLLDATPLHSVCPYKGQASYWKVKGGEQEVAWAYLDPIAECPRIKGLIAFYNERVDEVWVDAELETRPPHRWHPARPFAALPAS
jgi:uncharacterized protein (DUF427 family)